jgi:hypothetical protein
MTKPDALIVMRLANMYQTHPGADLTKVCSKCGQRVGIYPSGLRQLRAHPGLPIICVICASREAPAEVELHPAGTPGEILQEMRESVRVKR